MPKIAIGKKALDKFLEDPAWGIKLENCKNMKEVEAVLEEFAKSKGFKKSGAPTK
jgi:hypothetical protein